VRLADLDPRATPGVSQEESAAILARGLERLKDIQERLWAENRQKLLIVLQGIDTAGKSGTIDHVVGAFNPQGCDVHGFKIPTEEEAAHDYLWRAHAWMPRSGGIAVFDRSYYEDVLVVRVHDLVPKERWSRRYDQINAFERLLVEEGTRILKFFLYIDKDAQRERLQSRFDDPSKRWKFRLGDLEERKRWDDYIAAFEDMLERCSTEIAPWYLVPASHNWFRNLAVAEIVAEALEEMDPRFPPAPEPLPDRLTVA
jgi:PPK2 family polyphosphate:nucleotide phosphotransferase